MKLTITVFSTIIILLIGIARYVYGYEGVDSAIEAMLYIIVTVSAGIIASIVISVDYTTGRFSRIIIIYIVLLVCIIYLGALFGLTCIMVISIYIFSTNKDTKIYPLQIGILILVIISSGIVTSRSQLVEITTSQGNTRYLLPGRIDFVSWPVDINRINVPRSSKRIYIDESPWQVSIFFEIKSYEKVEDLLQALAQYDTIQKLSISDLSLDQNNLNLKIDIQIYLNNKFPQLSIDVKSIKFDPHSPVVWGFEQLVLIFSSLVAILGDFFAPNSIIGYYRIY